MKKKKNNFFAAQDLENMNLQEKFETIGTLTLKKRKLRLNLTAFSYGETATRRKEIIFSVSVEDRTRSDGHKFSNRKFSWTLGTVGVRTVSWSEEQRLGTGE